MWSRLPDELALRTSRETDWTHTCRNDKEGACRGSHWRVGLVQEREQDDKVRNVSTSKERSSGNFYDVSNASTSLSYHNVNIPG
jgi:hypothetical protein